MLTRAQLDREVPGILDLSMWPICVVTPFLVLNSFTTRFNHLETRGVRVGPSYRLSAFVLQSWPFFLALEGVNIIAALRTKPLLRERRICIDFSSIVPVLGVDCRPRLLKDLGTRGVGACRNRVSDLDLKDPK